MKTHRKTHLHLLLHKVFLIKTSTKTEGMRFYQNKNKYPLWLRLFTLCSETIIPQFHPFVNRVSRNFPFLSQSFPFPSGAFTEHKKSTPSGAWQNITVKIKNTHPNRMCDDKIQPYPAFRQSTKAKRSTSVCSFLLRYKLYWSRRSPPFIKIILFCFAIALLV